MGLKRKLFLQQKTAGLLTIKSLLTKLFVLPVHFSLYLMLGIIMNFLW